MIRFESRFDAYAYRMSFPVKDGVTVEEGQWVELDENSELVLATADSAKAFMAMGSNREGRDQIKGRAVKQIAVLHGCYSVTTDQVTGSLAPMDALKVGAGGKLVKATLPVDAAKVVATVLNQTTVGTKVFTKVVVG